MARIRWEWSTGLWLRASPDERAAVLPGDDVVASADVVMDRAFTVDASPDAVWPWLVQLGKGRAGWYLPAWVERVVPRSRRGIRQLDPRFLGLAAGAVVPDWGSADASFTVLSIEPPSHLLYGSTRGRVALTCRSRDGHGARSGAARASAPTMS